MEKALEFLRQELGMIKTGRATSALIENIIVEAYDTKMRLMELGTIAVPDPNQLVVTPFDQSVLKNIEKALSMDRGLGLMPVVDGGVVRIKVPVLTAERRQELVKLLHQKLEAGKIMIRQIRHEKLTSLKAAFENKEIHEDQKYGKEQDLQKITDDFTSRIEQMGKDKEQELLQI